MLLLTIILYRYIYCECSLCILCKILVVCKRWNLLKERCENLAELEHWVIKKNTEAWISLLRFPYTCFRQVICCSTRSWGSVLLSIHRIISCYCFPVTQSTTTRSGILSKLPQNGERVIKRLCLFVSYFSWGLNYV